MKTSTGLRLFKAVHSYMLFFLVVAFIVSCCMMLFITTLGAQMGVTFTQDNIEAAAKITMANVLLLTLILTVCDRIRRKWMVDRPVRIITQAGRRLMQGDFTVRIAPIKGLDRDDGFCEIAALFNQMAQELSSVETLRTDFVANVSHEIKTPLAVMQNYGTMLQAPDLTEERRVEYAKAITGACRRLANLITNILKLNKLENQHITPADAPIDLSEQVCECLLQFEEMWEQKGIQIETEIEEGVTLCSDAELLSLVWNNLFSNAFKFTPTGGTVTVRVYATAHHAAVQVSDTGCGMSPAVGAHIFDKFYQGDTSHATQGNGLGLALVRRVVDILHGTIEVESTSGVGSTFTVTLRR